MADLMSDGETSKPAPISFQGLKVAFVQDDQAFGRNQLAEDRSAAILVVNCFPAKTEIEFIEQLFDIETGLQRMTAPKLSRSSFNLGLG